jgi:hypothetical protein
LQLTSNRLVVINADLFTTVPDLRDLGLGDNLLSTLNSRTFTPIPYLETLRLGNNNFEILNVNILQNLTQLQVLLLNGNNFDNFQANFFRHLPNLKQLNINDNKVTAAILIEISENHYQFLDFSSPSSEPYNLTRTHALSVFRCQTILSTTYTSTHSCKM